MKKFIDWNKVLSNTSCVVRGEDARTRIGSDVCKKTIDQRVYAIKKAYRNSANKISLSGNVFSDEKWAPSLLAGKLSIEKKVCGFELCLQLSKRYTSLLARKILHCAVSFLPSKVTYIFCITLDPVQIRRIFFSLGNPPYAKKSKREPIFWLVTRPFSQRKISSLFSLILNSRHKRDHIIWKQILFAFKFIY